MTTATSGTATSGMANSGMAMADDGENSQKQLGERRETFDGFISATKWAVILVALALILMAVFLV
ncbi:aa3-type cytochrome c oxidase subunit IV [Polymorphobacter fuscus]|uniref:Aa3-type cytochrome c oxidase subunit IV n=1 Tax=Sandarakinorhabdus fusca TaxID=1439888 RepID=A0A7C9KVT6_9SPHN|nr:aa3-type cytochrome c oxidase subunit IV [Polymorphobacter fuscus]KAB7648880.1 aa3-type cytochrome c oxidase subunit IV [Polymorphobacter fuscus]MQT16465.1 aa3-type cytochrome c oxidase subunit IV [Polymorphobacter fuscus]NJC07245.1 hypothetical protein [Polymorphobacter fuscus]